MISLRTHNVLDYVGAVALIASPYLFGFADIPAARTLFLVLGFGLAIYSAMTKYYYSVLKIIPVGLHMAFDVSAGIITLLGPWLFGYRNLLTGGQLALHFVLGLGVLALVTFTDRKSTPLSYRSGTEVDRPNLRRVA